MPFLGEKRPYQLTTLLGPSWPFFLHGNEWATWKSLLPPSWHKFSVALQHEILARMRNQGQELATSINRQTAPGHQIHSTATYSLEQQPTFFDEKGLHKSIRKSLAITYKEALSKVVQDPEDIQIGSIGSIILPQLLYRNSRNLLASSVQIGFEVILDVPQRNNITKAFRTRCQEAFGVQMIQFRLLMSSLSKVI